MSLHIVIGFDAQGNAAKSHAVYTGPSRAEAQKAMEESNAVRFEIFSNVTGIRKNNSRHVPPPLADQPGANPDSRKRKR